MTAKTAFMKREAARLDGVTEARTHQPDFDGDRCPHCKSDKTLRIDVMAHEPDVWHCECATCGKGFEVLGVQR